MLRKEMSANCLIHILSGECLELWNNFVRSKKKHRETGDVFQNKNNCGGHGFHLGG